MLITFNTYLMPFRLYYCQTLALRYIPYRFQGAYLNRIEEDEGTEIIRIDFDIAYKNYYDNANNLLYKIWTETKDYIANNKNSVLNNKSIRLYIGAHDQVTGVCNYIADSKTNLGNEWVYYGGNFRSWKEAEEFCDVYGMDCYIADITDVESINVQKWKNLKYIHVWTYNDQSVKDMVKAKLCLMFPDTEISVY